MSCNCCECCSKELDQGPKRCSSTKIEDSTSNEALSQCECNKCCKKVRGRFGLAWLVETPGCKYEEPTGWQIEYIDTPSRVFQKCQHMVSWVNSPPMDCSANQSSERYFPIPPTAKCPSSAEPAKCQCCEENSESESSDYCDCFEQGYNNNYSERHSDNFSCCCANSNHSNGSSNRPLLCRCEDTRRSSSRKSSLKSSKCCKNNSSIGSDSHRRSKSPVFGEEIYNGDKRSSKSSDKQKFKCCGCENPIPKVEKCCKCKSVKVETCCNCANQTGSTSDSYEKLSKICSCSQQRPKVELPKCRCCCCSTENNNSNLENTENELPNTTDKNMSTTDNSMKQLEPAEPVEKAHSKRPKTQRRKNKT